MSLGRAIRRAAAAASLAVALSGGTAEAVTINFDDLDAPGRDNGVGLPVVSQYSGQGVTFNDLDAFDYSKPTPIPGFAHSGTVAVEPCVGAENCTAPVRATFTVPQRRVGAWVGFSGPLVEPLGVRLTAFDGSSTVIGTDDATLPANSTPTSIQTHLEVDAPPARIVRMEVSVTTAGGFSSGLAVDDVEFSRAGPPPPCTATGPPTVTLAQPLQFTLVQNNEFLLQGEVDGKGAPITAASITATSSGGTTRGGSIFPALVRSEGGTFGPVRLNGLLFDPYPAGFNDVVVSATNCAGTSNSQSRRVYFKQLSPATRFRQLGQIEVTQSVQTPLDSVPLVAASPNGAKRTFARVYLTVEPQRIDEVTGSLTAIRPDGSRPPGPLRVFSDNGTFNPSIFPGPLEDQRLSLGTALAFELPPEWLTAGPLHLELEHIYIEGTESHFPCDDCDNRGPLGQPPGQIGPSTVRFHETPPVRLWLVSMPYKLKPSDTIPIVPSQTEVDTVASVIRRMYPAADVQITQMRMPIADTPPKTCKEARGRVQDWAATIGTQDPRTRYLGLLESDPAVSIEDDDGNKVGGCAQRPGHFGWVFASDELGGAHELGHMYGRKHVAGCQLFEGSSVDGGFPHPSGLIGDETFGDAQGFDAGDTAVSAPKNILDWRNGIADVMTYCDDQWISDYNYGNLLGTLCDEDPGNCPDSATLTGHARTRPVTRAKVAAKAKRKPRLQVRATVSANGRGRIDSLAVLGGLTPTPAPKRGKLQVVLRGAGGRTLARHRVKDVEVGEDSARSVDAVVAFKPGTRRISLTRSDRTLDSARVSKHSPTVALLKPKPKKRLGERVKVRWRARDADGGRLTSTVLYAADGKHYAPVANDLRGRSARVDLSELGGGRRAALRVVVSDGVLTAGDTSKRHRVPAKPPRVSIATPANGAALTEGEPVQLVASVLDPQDIPFGASGVVWSSSLAGELGRGAALSATLPPGTQELTATATNSAGLSAAASVTVDVHAVPPVFTVP